MIKRGFIIEIIILILIASSFVNAFAPFEEAIEKNNPIEEYRNNFPFVDEGIIRLDKSLEKIPYTFVSSVQWDDEDFPAKIVFKDYKVSISNEDNLKISAQKFLDTYSDILGLEGIDLRIKAIYFPSVSVLSPSPSPVPSPSPSASDWHPSQKIATVVFEQVITNPAVKENYPVAGSFVVLGFAKDKDNVWRQVLYKANVVRDFSLIEQKPILSQSEAVQEAKKLFGNINPAYFSIKEERVDLLGYPVNNQKSLAWAYKIVFEESNVHGMMEKYVIVVDANFGQLLNFYDILMRERVSGRITGSIYPTIPTKDQIDNIGFEDEYVVISDSQDASTSAITQENGLYQINIDDAQKLESKLAGPWANAIDAHSLQTISITRPILEGYNINWKDYDTSYKQEESNVFYHTNIMHDYAVQPHINAEKMNFEMPAFVNHQQSCNAYYSRNDKETLSERSINFFTKGFRGDIECEATSLFSDIVYHEYGHGITDSILTLNDEAFPYEGETGNLHEGLSDYVACSVSDIRGSHDPACMDEIKIGKENTCFRRCDTDQKYPDDYGDEPHAGMQIISGALWDIREKLISKYGKEEGIKRIDGLVYGALRFQPTSFADYVDAMIFADDNNGNPDDGSQNIESICSSFAEHGIYSAYCAGFSDIPIAIIHVPKKTGGRFGENFIGDEILDVIGTVFPSKDATLEYWRLTISDIGSEGSEEILSIEKTNSIKKGILVENFDFSQLKIGHKYFIVLEVKDSNQKFASYSFIFRKSHNVKIEILNKPELMSFYSIQARSFPDSELKRIFTFCNKEDICEASFDIFSDKADFIVHFFVEKLEGLEAYMHYIFMKKYFNPDSSLEIDFSLAKRINSNIKSILENKNVEIFNHGFEIYAERFGNEAGMLIFDGWFDGTFNHDLEYLNLYYDKGLFFNDYLIYHKWLTINNDEKRILSFGYIIKYPFPGSAFIDESKLSSVKIGFFNPFKEDVFLFLDNHPLDFYPFGYGTFYNDNNPKNPRPNNIYSYEFYPEINEIKLNHRVVGLVENFVFARWFFNGKGVLFNAPESLSSDIDIFKDPFSLEIKEENVFFASGPNMGNDRYVLRGYIIDNFKDAKGVFEHDGFLFGELEITLPDGSVESISNSWGGQYGSWIIDCNMDEWMSFSSYVFRDKEKFCQIGEYKIEWTFGDTNGDGKGDFFADERIIKLKTTYSFDGSKFNIKESSPIDSNKFLRGDVNSDRRVDISDAAFALSFLFQGNLQPNCMDALDVNDDGIIDVSDPIKILSSLFKGDTIPEPYPNLGFDLTVDNFIC